MDLQEFRTAFDNIRERGFIRTTRSGPTGVGHTLESALKLEENNLVIPDLGTIELKAHRDNSTSMITLFTFNRNAWVMRPLDAVRKYGTLDKKGRKGLYFTMNLTPNSAGLFLTVQDDQVYVQDTSGNIVVKWKTKDLSEQFAKKMPALILVSAETEWRGKVEYFRYHQARLLSGISSRLIADQLRVGSMVVDLRLHDKGTMARNHGTGFRAFEAKLDRLFTHSEEL